MSDVLGSLIQAVDQNRLAHAYLLVSPLRSGAEGLIGGLLAHLFGRPELVEMKRLRMHPDVAWVEPASRSRRILVDDLDVVLQRLTHTSYEGGWKVAVVFDADRMNDAVANKFLKTLEEPPGRSLILLVSSQPEDILPTIKSRCQVLRLGAGVEGMEDSALRGALLDVLVGGAASSGMLGALGVSQALQVIFEQVRAEVTEQVEALAGEDTSEDVIKARVQSQFRALQAEMLAMMQFWYRDVLLVKMDGAVEALYFKEQVEVLREQAAGCGLMACYRRIEQLDVMAGQLERNIPLKDVLEAGALALAGV